MANTTAYGVNSSGDICGLQNEPSIYAIAWPDGANSSADYQTLAVPTGFAPSHTTAISSNSTIIGYAYNGSAVHALRWTKSGSSWPSSSAQDLNAPAGGQAFAYAIADDGSVAGKGNVHYWRTVPCL